MSLFSESLTPASLNALCAGTAVSTLGIEFTETGPDFLVARMPVDARTRQPFGLLHGGASVLLAETLGSVASGCCVPEGKMPVGLDINANHLRAVREGHVQGRVTPVHVGRSTHVWEIRISDTAGRLVCLSRLTVQVLDRP